VNVSIKEAIIKSQRIIMMLDYGKELAVKEHS